jgi:hypothetical protein
MQNTNKKRNKTLCVKSPETELTELTTQLFTWFDYHHIKVNTNDLLLGWLASSYFEPSTNERIQICDFFANALIYFSATQKICYEKQQVTPALFNEIMHINFEYSRKDARRYCKKALYFFLEGNISDDNSVRNDVMNMMQIIRKYFADAYKVVCKEI